jgi:hypothetical protein
MAEWLAGQLESLGAQVERAPLGKQTLDGQELDLPPALLGSYGNDPKKKTVCARLHVSPPSSHGPEFYGCELMRRDAECCRFWCTVSGLLLC